MSGERHLRDPENAALLGAIQPVEGDGTSRGVRCSTAGPGAFRLRGRAPHPSASKGGNRWDRKRGIEQYASVAKVATEAIRTIDEGSVIRSAGQAVEELFGYEPDELRGEPRG